MSRRSRIAGLRGRPPKFDGRPRTASGSLLSGGGGGGGDRTAGTTRSLGDQTVAELSCGGGAFDSVPVGFVPYAVRLHASPTPLRPKLPPLHASRW